MSLLRRLSIRSQLLLVLLLIGLCGVAAVTIVGYISGRNALEQAVFKQLTSVRSAKVTQLQDYFKTVRADLETLAEDPTFVGIARDLESAYLDLSQASLPSQGVQSVRGFYEKEFLPRLSATTGGRPTVETYLPTDPPALYLQYHYLAKNPNDWDNRDKLNRAGDTSRYSQVHARIHPFLRAMAERLGYYDIYLISLKTNSVLYSISKEPDFASNLLSGPFSDSSLAKAYLEAKKIHDPGHVVLSDFRVHTPSFGAPSAFFAAPIFDHAERVGVLILQLSVEEVDRVMTGGRDWQKEGLGKTGEAYLVGEDGLFRSNARFLLENPKYFLRALRKTELQPKIIEKIGKLNTSILIQRAHSKADRSAATGKSGIGKQEDYRGKHVLVSYQPLVLEGLRWGLVSKMDEAEALAPVAVFGKRVIMTAVLFVVVVTMLCLWLSAKFLRPVRALVDAAHAVGQGRDDVKVEEVGSDEFSELAHTFNSMVASLHKSNDALKRKTQENEALLLNVLPAPIAARVKSGQDQVADSIPNVTVLYADLPGFSELSDNGKASEVVGLLNEIVTSFDEAAERHGVEKVKTIGSAYMAVCGLSVPRVDHMHRVVQFAKEMADIVHRICQRHNAKLDVSIGINSGSVIAGIVGRHKFIYDLWGDTVNLARGLQRLTKMAPVRVTQVVRDGLVGVHDFEAVEPYDAPGKGAQPVWVLKQG